MDLKQHLDVGQPGVGERGVHPHHGPANDVGGGTLDRGVDGRTFAELALGTGFRMDGRDVDLAAEQGRDEAGGADLGAGAVHIVADAGEAFEIGLDIGPGLGLIDAQLVRQAEGADPVDDAEIDRLGAAAGFGGHAFDRDAEHL